MEIESTPLFLEATRIMQSGQTNTNFGWRAIVDYGDNQLYVPLKVISVNNIRNYVDAYTDEMTITLLVPLGAYARRIYPNRARLQITLTKIYITETGGAVRADDPSDNEVYSAILLGDTLAPTEMQGAESVDEFSLDLKQVLEIHFQLFNKSMEQIRFMIVGGIFRRTKVDTLLRSILTKESSKADVDNQRAIEGIDLSPISNKDTKEQIVITDGTKLVDVPDYLQKRIGIYSSGLGNYIQNRHWYLFPLFDTNLFQDRQNTLTIIVLPKNKFTNIERTYSKRGDCLTILMTSETGFQDDSGAEYINDGNGARFTDAAKVLTDSVTIKNNKAVISRKRNNNEFITDTKPDGLNHTPIPNERITSNPFVITSRLNNRRGGYFKGVWQNSDPKLITPGMVTRLIYSDLKEIKEFYGVVHKTDNISHMQGDINANRYSNQSVLTVFVNKSK